MATQLKTSLAGSTAAARYCNPTAFHGPFLSAGGDIYVMVTHTAGATTVPHMYSASDVTGTWTDHGVCSIDDSFLSSAPTYPAYTTVQFGDDIFVFYSDAEGNSETTDVTTFSMSSDTWDADWVTIDSSSYYSASMWVSACVSENASTPKIVVAYGGPAYRDMGNNWDQVWASSGTTQDNFVTPVLISHATTTAHRYRPAVTFGSGEWTHILFSAASAIYGRSFKPSDSSTSSIVTMTNGVWGSSGAYIHSGIGYSSGSAWEIRFIGRSVATAANVVCQNCYEDGSQYIAQRSTNNVTVDTTGSAGPTNTSVLVFDSTNNKEYAVYSEGTNSNGFSYTSRSGSASPSAFGSITTCATGNYTDNVSAAIVTRSGAVYLDAYSQLTNQTTETEYWNLETVSGGATPKSGSDTLYPRIVEGTVDFAKETSDVLLPRINEGTVSFAKLTYDSLAPYITEDKSLLLTISSSDFITIGWVDDSTLAVMLTSNDTLYPRLDEGAVEFGKYTYDSILPRIDEGAIGFGKYGTDTLLPRINEGEVGFGRYSSDTLLPMIVDALASLSLPKSTSDTLYAKIDEGTVSFVKVTSDILLPQILENTFVLGTLSSSDILYPYILESSSVNGIISASDFILPRIDDALAALALPKSANDILRAKLDEGSVSFSKETFDSILPQILESTFVLNSLSSSDTLYPYVLDNSSVFGVISASDFILPRIDEGATAIAVALSANDILYPRINEGTVAFEKSTSDLLAVQLVDSAALQVLLSGADEILIAITDSGIVGGATLKNANDTIYLAFIEETGDFEKATADALTLAISEGHLFDTISLSRSDNLLITFGLGRYLDDGSLRVKRYRRMAKGKGIGIGLK